MSTIQVINNGEDGLPVRNKLNTNFSNLNADKVESVNGKTGVDIVLASTDLTDTASIVYVGNDITGNASTATALETARDIAGSSFDGSASIDISHAGLTDIGSNTHAQIDTFIASKGSNDGLASLDSSGKVPTAQIPDLAISEYLGNFADLTAAITSIVVISSQRGDWFTVDTDGGQSYIVITDSPTTSTDVKKILTPTDAVLSVNGQTGAVSLASTDLTDSSNIAKKDAVNEFTNDNSFAGTAGYNTTTDMGSADTDFAHRKYVNDLVGAEQYTGTLTNTKSIISVGEGEEAGTPFTTYDGALAEEIEEGNTLVNIVDGEGVANGGTVSWDSVLNDIYYDSLNNVLLTGTGASMTATNNSGDVANMNIFNLTAQDIADKTTAEMVDLLGGNYIDGIEGTFDKKITSIGKNLFNPFDRRDGGLYNSIGSWSVNESFFSTGLMPVKQGKYYIHNRGAVSNFNQLDINGNFIRSSMSTTVLIPSDCYYLRTSCNITQKAVSEYQIEEGTTVTAYEPYTSNSNYISNLYKGDTVNAVTGIKTQNKKYSTIATATAINTTNFPDAKSGGSFICLQDDYTLLTGVIDGTTTTTDAGEIVYELDEAIVIKVINTPLYTETSGTIVIENKFNAGWFQYTSAGIDLTNTGYDTQSISLATKATSEGQEILDVSDFVNTANVFTNPNLNDGDWVWLEVEHNKGTIPTLEYSSPMNTTGSLKTLNTKVAELSENVEALQIQVNSLERKPVGVFAYMSSASDTVMTDADTWYRLEGAFTNSIVEGFTTSSNGIELTAGDVVLEAEYMTGGNASATAIISIAIVKNATFDANGKLLTGTQLDGSGGLDEVTTVSAASGFGNPRGFWVGLVETGDTISIVVKSSVASETWTPLGGSASIHRFF